MHYNTIEYNTIQYYTTQYYTIHNTALHYNTIPDNEIQYKTNMSHGAAFVSQSGIQIPVATDLSC